MSKTIEGEAGKMNETCTHRSSGINNLSTSLLFRLASFPSTNNPGVTTSSTLETSFPLSPAGTGSPGSHRPIRSRKYSSIVWKSLGMVRLGGEGYRVRQLMVYVSGGVRVV